MIMRCSQRLQQRDSLYLPTFKVQHHSSRPGYANVDLAEVGSLVRHDLFIADDGHVPDSAGKI